MRKPRLPKDMSPSPRPWAWGLVPGRNGAIVKGSEYHAPNGFTPIWSVGKCVLMHAKGATGKVREYIFVADRYANRFQTDLFNCI